jgi:hypothetical protein
LSSWLSSLYGSKRDIGWVSDVHWFIREKDRRMARSGLYDYSPEWILHNGGCSLLAPLFPKHNYSKKNLVYMAMKANSSWRRRFLVRLVMTYLFEALTTPLEVTAALVSVPKG